MARKRNAISDAEVIQKFIYLTWFFGPGFTGIGNRCSRGNLKLGPCSWDLKISFKPKMLQTVPVGRDPGASQLSCQVGKTRQQVGIGSNPGSPARPGGYHPTELRCQGLGRACWTSGLVPRWCRADRVGSVPWGLKDFAQGHTHGLCSPRSPAPGKVPEKAEVTLDGGSQPGVCYRCCSKEHYQSNTIPSNKM